MITNDVSRNKVLTSKAEFRMYRSQQNKSKFDVYKVWGTMLQSDNPDDWDYDYEVVLQGETFEAASKFIEDKEQF